MLRANWNTRFHDGHVSFNDEQDYLIYNRNQPLRSKEGIPKLCIYKLDLYEANYLSGTWYNERSFKFNQQNSSTAHPVLSADGKLLFRVRSLIIYNLVVINFICFEHFADNVIENCYFSTY